MFSIPPHVLIRLWIDFPILGFKMQKDMTYHAITTYLNLIIKILINTWKTLTIRSRTPDWSSRSLTHNTCGPASTPQGSQHHNLHFFGPGSERERSLTASLASYLSGYFLNYWILHTCVKFVTKHV